MEKLLSGQGGDGGAPVPAGDVSSAVSVARGLGGLSVVLVGLMGAGKSTVGRRLAQRLSLPFRDADSEIEAAARMPITDIFATYGEPSFRDLEKRVISRLMEQGRIVLATGGGAFMSQETRALVAVGAVSVWLKADHETLMRRVRRRTHRPLLQTADPDETMRALMAERYPVYAQADVTVESRDASHERVTQGVIDALAVHLAGRPS